MKQRILFVFVAAFTLLSACIRDDVDTIGSGGRDKDSRKVTISFSPLAGESAQTRAYHYPDELDPGNGVNGSPAEGREADKAISDMWVLMYDKTGRLAEDLYFDSDDLEEIEEDGYLTAEVWTGVYDFVFITNTNTVTGSQLYAQLSDEENIEAMHKLAGITIPASLYDDELDIPMVGIVRNVEVVGDNDIQVGGGGSSEPSPWQPELTRTGIRLSMEITLSSSQYAGWETTGGKQITVSRIPASTYLLGANNYTTQTAPYPARSYTASTTAFGQPGALDGFIDPHDSAGEDDGATIYYDRIILPELMFSPVDEEDYAMELSMNVGSGAKTAKIAVVDDALYAVERNTWLHLDVTVKDDELQITPEVVEWNGIELEDVLVDGQYTLEVDRSVLGYLSGGGTQDVNIRTNHPGGWTISVLTPSPAFTATFDTTSGGSGTAWNPVSGTVSSNNTATTPRYVDYIVEAGSMRKKIRIVQQGTTAGDPPSTVIPYVGAFWKADQTGERLIRVPRPADTAIDGMWTATVVEGDEWIRLDNSMTLDQNVGWRTDNGTPTEANVANGNDMDFDRMYPVHGDAIYVEGTVSPATPDGVFFRIGLTGAYIPTATAPVRYGAVLVTYADGAYSQLLYLRQGEGADYLMKDNDPDIGSAPETRTGTVEFSPYNLTAAQMSENIEYVTLDQYGGVPVEYPTQAGAMLQFASSTNLRRAYHPTKFYPQAPGGWDATGTTWSPTHETCPPGYRRPDSGSNRHTSEMARSLIADLSSGSSTEIPNSAWGYYADGFFDRRMTGKQNSTLTGSNAAATAHSAVAIGTKDVAYVGRLFYNPGGGNSLFFPASGMLENAVGELHNAGSYGHYWSRTASGNDNARTISISEDNDVPNPTAESRSRGYSVRCVTE